MITANNQTPAAQANPYEMSSHLMGGAANQYQSFTEGAGSLGNINAYVNPYYDQVLGSVLGRMNENNAMQVNQLGDQAQAAGAFGGSRHGVAEGYMRGEHNRNVGDISNQMHMQGWQDAADRAYRDKVTGTQGMANMGQNYFGIGNQIQQNQMQQGSMQQNLLQMILNQGQEQFNAHQQYPMQMIDMMNALQQGDIRRGTSVGQQSSTPGLFDYLSLAAGVASGIATGGASIPALGIIGAGET